MRWLLFLSRVAFVCNCFFLVALSLQFGRWFKNEDAESLVIILGYFMSVPLNAVAVVCYLLFSVRHRHKLSAVPRWLRIANCVFLVLQLFYIRHLNAQ